MGRILAVNCQISFDEEKKKLSKEEVLIHIDFSENYENC